MFPSNLMKTNGGQDLTHQCGLLPPAVLLRVTSSPNIKEMQKALSECFTYTVFFPLKHLFRGKQSQSKEGNRRLILKQRQVENSALVVQWNITAGPLKLLSELMPWTCVSAHKAWGPWCLECAVYSFMDLRPRRQFSPAPWVLHRPSTCHAIVKSLDVDTRPPGCETHLHHA